MREIEADHLTRAGRLISEELLTADLEGIQTYERIDGSPDPICPGDFIRPTTDGHLLDTSTLPWVHPKDVLITAIGQLVYCPSSFYRPGMPLQRYLNMLAHEGRDRLFLNGELSSIHQHWSQCEKIREFAFRCETARSDIHGPAHWRRVQWQGISLARALGIDPLVPFVFGLVHDSHRENDEADHGHGPRAAVFVREQRNALFSFLSDDQVRQLRTACKQHSVGKTDTPDLAVSACWDADRLDLARPGVGITPDPAYLCSDYARRPDVIEFARIQALDEEWSDAFFDASDIDRRQALGHTGG